MPRFAFLACFAFLVACGSKAPQLVQGLHEAPELTIFQGVNVFAGDATASVPNQDVWVVAGKISWVGETGLKPAPNHATIVEGAGKTLLPGLIDLHTHTSGVGAPPWAGALPNPERNMEAFLFAGITTVVDLGGALDESYERREALREGRLVGPRMLFAGPHFTAPDGHPVAMLRAFLPWPIAWLIEDDMGAQVATVEDVDDAFEDYLAAQVDIIKISNDQIPLGIPTIDADVAKAVVARAHANGLKAVAHIGAVEDVHKMIDAGVDGLVHGVYRDRLTESTARLLAEKNIAVAPTLTVFDSLDRMVSREYQVSAMQRAVGEPSLVSAVAAGPGDYETPEIFLEWLDALRAHREIKFENVMVLKQAGVAILAGSDSPNVGLFAGALHEELEALVVAGLTPAEALRAATYENAKFLNLLPSIGVIEAGATADLLLVNGDPAVDIRAVHDIAGVYQAGREVRRVASSQ